MKSALKKVTIPQEVKHLLIRVLMLFIAWKLIYHLCLYDNRLLDKPLTDVTAYGTKAVLQLVYTKDTFSSKEQVKPFSLKDSTKIYRVLIKKNNKPVIGIADGCNALDIYVILLGFILAIPRGLKRMIIYSLLGVVVVYTFNTARAIILALMNIQYNQINDFAHHYLFKLIVYGVVFFIWVKYLKTTTPQKNEV